MSEEMPTNCYHHFGDDTQWAYSYAHRIESAEQLQFLNAYDVEFIPSVHGFFVDSQTSIGATVNRCYLTETSRDEVNTGNPWHGSPVCNGHAELSAQLALLISQLRIRPEYLFGANEPLVLCHRTKLIDVHAHTPVVLSAQVVES